jgi:hypothetical protein
LTTSTIAQIQKANAARPTVRKSRTRSPLAATVDLPARWVPSNYPTGVGEGRSYPTERERAITASLLGAVLGLVLAVFAGRRRT